ncbi:hypothetical protein BD779DRAFT_1784387 [Infundibulicybe gibba]|nr:hypothetical protein BD779DRAFT_1784387 [Infundibulicybe gibba]
MTVGEWAGLQPYPISFWRKAHVSHPRRTATVLAATKGAQRYLRQTLTPPASRRPRPFGFSLLPGAMVGIAERQPPGFDAVGDSAVHRHYGCDPSQRILIGTMAEVVKNMIPCAERREHQSSPPLICWRSTLGGLFRCITSIGPGIEPMVTILGASELGSRIFVNVLSPCKYRGLTTLLTTTFPPKLRTPKSGQTGRGASARRACLVRNAFVRHAILIKSLFQGATEAGSVTSHAHFEYGSRPPWFPTTISCQKLSNTWTTLEGLRRVGRTGENLRTGRTGPEPSTEPLPDGCPHFHRNLELFGTNLGIAPQESIRTQALAKLG